MFGGSAKVTISATDKVNFDYGGRLLSLDFACEPLTLRGLVRVKRTVLFSSDKKRPNGAMSSPQRGRPILELEIVVLSWPRGFPNADQKPKSPRLFWHLSFPMLLGRSMMGLVDHETRQ